MGQIAEKYADHIILTNDNPKEQITRAHHRRCKAKFNRSRGSWGDRSGTISLAITSAESSDTVIIAGKGHENYQLIGSKRYFFSDKKRVESSRDA